MNTQKQEERASSSSHLGGCRDSESLTVEVRAKRKETDYMQIREGGRGESFTERSRGLTWQRGFEL